MLTQLLRSTLRAVIPGARARFAASCYANARALAQTGELQAAARNLELGLAADPGNGAAWHRLGDLRFELGLVEDAIAAYRNALEQEPRLLRARSNLLFALCHREEDARVLLHEHRQFGVYATLRAPTGASAFPNARQGARRLRVAYVSGDLRGHAISMFIEPLLAGHDPARIEVFCYDNSPARDAIAVRLRSYRATWRDISGMDGAALETQARADAIDIMVDLCGHTGAHRLADMAQRLAPVQATYLGYHGGSGLAAMDYRISDAIADPEGMTEGDYLERLARLPHCLWCYRPPAHASISPPARTPGTVITFGSLNNPRKVSPRSVALWAQVLRRVPRARLVMAAGEGPASSAILHRLGAEGIDLSRVETVGWLAPARFGALHERIDIALDTYPFNGGATTIGALAQGVPVVSLSGAAPASRCGRTILTNVGLAELATPTEAQFVAAACELANDRLRLSQLQQRLPGLLRASPIMDEPRFVAEMEALYGWMWRQLGPA